MIIFTHERPYRDGGDDDEEEKDDEKNKLRIIDMWTYY